MLVRQGVHFHFRRAVPVRLRGIIGQAELWASLGTTSPTVARARACRLYADVEEIFALAEIARLTPPDPDAELRALQDASAEELALTVAALERKAELAERLAGLKSVQADARHAEEALARAAAAREQLARLTPLVERAAGRVGEAVRAGALAERMAGQMAAATAAMGAATASVPSGPVASHGRGIPGPEAHSGAVDAAGCGPRPGHAEEVPGNCRRPARGRLRPG